jgi:hypothetical protein
VVADAADCRRSGLGTVGEEAPQEGRVAVWRYRGGGGRMRRDMGGPWLREEPEDSSELPGESLTTEPPPQSRGPPVEGA